MLSADWLKRMLIDCLTQLSLETLNQATNQLPKKLMMVIKVNGPILNFIWTNNLCKEYLNALTQKFYAFF